MKPNMIITSILTMHLLVLSALTQQSDCICPTVTMKEAPVSVRIGEAVVFTVDVKGITGEITYNWTVTEGTITQGQGTPEIKVETGGLESSALTATVEVRGGWCPVCDNTTVSATVVLEGQIKPVLVDKFTRANCEELLARMDNFFIELQNNPGDQGYIIIYGKTKAVSAAERVIRNSIKFRNFDPFRLTIVRGGGNAEKAEIEMWRVPPGADSPEVAPVEETGETAEPEMKITKPYIFTAQYADGIDGCKPDFDMTGFAAEIKANPKSRANVVIYETSPASFRRVEKEILTELTKNGVARKRIKTFFVKVKPNYLLEAIELWFLP